MRKKHMDYLCGLQTLATPSCKFYDSCMQLAHATGAPANAPADKDNLAPTFRFQVGGRDHQGCPTTAQKVSQRRLEGKPEEPLDGKPEEPLEGKPDDPLEGRPDEPLDGKPDEPLDGKPDDPLEGNPEPPDPFRDVLASLLSGLA